jgi:poly-gamma-glutamate synthesis protein (capsule biosynthesis protein)
MARGFWAAAGASYERIVILSPDHFNRSRRPFATTRRNFDTVFGVVETDQAATSLLLKETELFDDSDLFDREHGIAALLPFVKHFFPDTRIVPIAISVGSLRADWDRAVELLRTLIGARVLVIQSTDYSHYLPLDTALARDQETLNVISANDLEALVQLVQPAHLDSKAAQYVQMRLQHDYLKSYSTVVANRNSEAYSDRSTRTTSYVVTVYTELPSNGADFQHPDQDIIYVAGDTYLGRWLTLPLADADVADTMVKAVRNVTGGMPLVINLEGALLEDPPEGLPASVHVMHASLAIPILKAMNVTAAGLANNHSHDLGTVGYQETLAVLAKAGIRPLGHAQILDAGPLRILGLNFIGKQDYRAYPVVKDLRELDAVCGMNDHAPLIAFVHWGREFTNVADTPEYAAAEALHRCGVSAIVGAHSHQSARSVQAIQGGEYQVTYSLGNFIFDQRPDRSSGALLEIRVFRQGTYASRLVPIPNFFALANAKLRAKGQPPIKERETTSVDSRED